MLLLTGTVNRDPEDPAVISAQLQLQNQNKNQNKNKTTVLLSLPYQLPPNFYSKL